MLRRVFDIVVCGMGLVLLSPLFLALTVVVRLTSPGPALYRARRVGKDGREFTLLKFRSMVADAEQNGPGITAADDTRITRIGHFLRNTKLDELPQLINVLRGEMSLVGPRPEDPRYVAFYTSEQRCVLQIRPGITSKASLEYRHEEQLLQGPDWEERYINIVMPDKLAIDLEYAQSASLWTNLKLIVRTVWCVCESFIPRRQKSSGEQRFVQSASARRSLLKTKRS